MQVSCSARAGAPLLTAALGRCRSAAQRPLGRPPQLAGLSRRQRSSARGGACVLVRAESSSGSADPFKPERAFHKGVVDAQEPEERTLFGRLAFGDIYYFLNITYWSLLLVSVLTGNDFVARLVHFEYYTTAMFASSAVFTLYHTAKFGRDLRQHLKSEARRDWRQMLRYCWNAVFWLAFVLWYAAPPVAVVADYTGTPGAVMCLYGAALAMLAALQVGHFSFMGSAQVPRRLHTGGVYALLRHPQALGNMLFLIGFSLAGGAVWASLTFVAAFALYCATVVPAEELMLKEAFGDEYERYRQRTPRFLYALVLLVGLQGLLLWRFQPWAIPIDATPPTGGA